VIYIEWERGNWRPKFDVYDPEMEWGWSSEFPGLEGVYHDPAIPREISSRSSTLRQRSRRRRALGRIPPTHLKRLLTIPRPRPSRRPIS
jgi:hypothetical protein